GVWAYNAAETVRRLGLRDSLLGWIAFGFAAWTLAALSIAEGVTDALALPAFLLGLLFLQEDRGVGARVLCSRVVNFLGAISYSVYMVHFPIFVLFGMVMKRLAPSSFLVDDAGVPQVVINPWLDDLLLLILVITVVATASLTYSRIEKP